MGKKSSSLRLKTALRTDERVRLTNEVISGIQAIKMYTWEHPFSDLIDKSRRSVYRPFTPNSINFDKAYLKVLLFVDRREISCIRSTSYIRGITMSFIMFSTRLSIFVTILAYVLEGHQIDAAKVFMLTAYYNILRQTMTVFFPQGSMHSNYRFIHKNLQMSIKMYRDIPKFVHKCAKFWKIYAEIKGSSINVLDIIKHCIKFNYIYTTNIRLTRSTKISKNLQTSTKICMNNVQSFGRCVFFQDVFISRTTQISFKE